MQSYNIVIPKSRVRRYFYIPLGVVGVILLLVGIGGAFSSGDTTLWLTLSLFGLVVTLASLWEVNVTYGELRIEGTVLTEWTNRVGRRSGKIDLAHLVRADNAISLQDYRHITKVNGFANAGGQGSFPIGLWDDAGQVYSLELYFYRRADAAKVMPALLDAFKQPTVKADFVALYQRSQGWIGVAATKALDWPPEANPQR